MQQKTYLIVVGVVFSLVTLAHLCRAVFQWQVTVGSVVIPMWASWVAIPVGAYLAVRAFVLGKRA